MEEFSEFHLTLTKQKKICVSHVSYETMCYDDFSDLPEKIHMIPGVKELPEMVVYQENNGDKDAFIQKLKQVYKEKSEGKFGAPYGCKILSSKLGQLRFYTEVEGYMVVPSALDPSIFAQFVRACCNARVIETEIHRKEEDSRYHNIFYNYTHFKAIHPFLKK